MFADRRHLLNDAVGSYALDDGPFLALPFET